MRSSMRLAFAAERRAVRVLRKMRAAQGPPVHVDKIRLRSPLGLQLYGHIHHLGLPGRHPAVVLIPGIGDPGKIFDGFKGPVSADEVARLGAIALHFDPAGRGRSWGTEDYGGPEHQDNIAAAVQYLEDRFDVDPDRIGVVAISLGVASAVGGIKAHGLDVDWLIDWEGPCDREIITAGGTRMDPAAGHGLDDDDYWKPREAVRHLDGLGCGYVRLQGVPDHAQPDETRHAMRMIEAAAKANLPWFQLNDHPRNAIPKRPIWHPGGALPANRIILQKIGVLLSEGEE